MAIIPMASSLILPGIMASSALALTMSYSSCSVYLSKTTLLARLKVDSDAWSSIPSMLYCEIMISDTFPGDSAPSEKRVSWYTKSTPPFFRSRSTSSRIITI